MFLTYFWDWTIITADFNFIAKCFQLFLQVIFPFLLHPLVEIFRTEFLILTSLFQYMPYRFQDRVSYCYLSPLFPSTGG